MNFVLVFFSILTLTLFSPDYLSQSPPGIPYQAEVRNESGALLANANVNIRFTLHELTASGAVSYQETHALTTNELGLFAATIGAGTATQGTFAGINWAQTNKFLQVEADAGNGYITMGNQQLMSVPYAMYAASSGNGNIGQPNPSYNPSSDSVLTMFSAGTVAPGSYTIPSKEYWKIISFYTLPGYGGVNVQGTLQGAYYNTYYNQYGCVYNTPPTFTVFQLNGIQYNANYTPAYNGLELWNLCGLSPCASCAPTKSIGISYSFTFPIPTPFWLSPGESFSLNDPNARLMVEKYK
jgi:hypothetical protein